MSDTREHLKPYTNQYVNVFGYYTKQGITGQPHNRTALVCDCEITTADGQRHFCGHIWVQRASAIVSEKPLVGDKLKFTAFINEYEKRSYNKDGTVSYPRAWGLANPSEVDIEGREPDNAYRLPLFQKPVLQTNEPQHDERPEPPISPAPSPVKVLKAITELTKSVPLGTLKLVVPHLSAISETICLAGGIDVFAECLDLLEIA